MVQAAPNLEGLNHRTRPRMDLSQGVYDGVDESRWYFHSANWQVLEEHIDTDLDDDTDRIGQQFWGVRYIDDAVARRVDRDGDGTFTGDPDDNFFYLTDAMFSVRALVDGEGRLHTRLDYTPYGVAMHGKAADVNGDGVLNFTDITAFNAVYNGGTALRPGETGYDPDADLAGSGSMNFFDYTAFTSRFSDYSSGPSFNAGWIDNPEDPNGPDNSVGYDGYWFDLAGATEATSTGLYMVRHRVYDPKLGRWLQRDPLGYVDGLNLYQYGLSSPQNYADPSGLSCQSNCESGCPKPSGTAWPTHSLELHRPLPDSKCVERCRLLCQASAAPNCPCDPTGKVTFDKTTVPGTSGISLRIVVTGEDSDCCSEIAVIQYVRRNSWPYGWGEWQIDDGRVLNSDKSDYPPYYQKPSQILTNGVGGTVLTDEPGMKGRSTLWEFRVVVICSKGPAAGHVYGTYSWHVGTSTISNKPWQPVDGAPGGDNIANILK